MIAELFSYKSMASEDIWREVFGSMRSKTGKSVTLKTAVEVSCVFAANRVIGNGMAQVPLRVMQLTEGGKKPATDHPLFRLLALQPNRWQTSFQYRQQASWHVELTGNHYSFINRIGNEVKELFPFEPNRVVCKNLGQGEYEYVVTAPDGKMQTFPSESILHLKGPTWDGMNGMEVIKTAREAIGLSIVAEESAAVLNKNGIRTSGAYSVEGTLKGNQYKELSDWITEHHAGPENAGKPLILDRAAKWTSNQMSAKDAQQIETRRYQIEEICRFFGIMPIMVGYQDKAMTFASSEQLFLAHITHCLAPRWEGYEQSLAIQLLSKRDIEDGFYFNFNEKSMLRGSAKDTKDVVLGYVNGGLITPNEGRDDIGLNPDSDPKSNELRIPVNITGPVDEMDGDGEGDEPESSKKSGDESNVVSFLGSLTSALK